MIRPLLACLLLFLPGALAAQCDGRDLRETLAPADRAALERAAAATAFAEGNHWIARKDGRRIHLIGTMHLDDPRWPQVVAALEPLVAAAGTLFVEMTAAEEAQMQARLAEDPGLMFITEGPTLPELLPEDQWRRLSAALAERGMPGFMAAKTQPWLLSLTLALPGCLTAEAARADGLDRRLIAAAERAGVPVRALEEPGLILDLMAGDPVETQLDRLIASLGLAEDSENQFATLTATYFDEAHAEAWEMSRLMARRGLDADPAAVEAMLAEMEERLLVARNRAWLPRILAAEGETLVVAAGALHLMGADGLPALLAARGWALERGPFPDLGQSAEPG